MKRFLIVLLLLCIIGLFLYCAYLDGVLAFAMNECDFCKFIEEHDLNADTQYFPQNTVGSMKSISYELVLNDKLIFGHDRVMRKALRYNVPMNFCPECGRRLD